MHLSISYDLSISDALVDDALVDKWCTCRFMPLSISDALVD